MKCRIIAKRRLNTKTMDYEEVKVFMFDDKEVTEKEFNAACPKKPLNLSGNSGLIGWKPVHCFALALHPNQIPNARKFLKERGVEAEYDGDGNPIMRTRQHYNAYLKAVCAFNKDAGYGDRTRS
jgi:hypothetical protein